MPIAKNWIDVMAMGQWGGTPWPLPASLFLPLGQHTLGTTTLGM